MIETVAIDMMLMHYAAGSLGPYESLVVAAHLSLNPDARKKMSRYEAEGGRLINKASPSPVTQACLESVLQRIDNPREESKAQHKTLPDGLTLPQAIATLLSKNCAENPRCWSKVAQGIETIELRICTSEPRQRKLRLMRLAPHQQTPLHRHAGREITLVLEGGFSDQTGHYKKGDLIVINDPSLIHNPRADDTGCLSLCLTEAPLRFTDPFTQMINLLRRL